MAWLLACAVSGFPYCLLGLPGCMNARPACVGVWLASHGRYLLRARLSCRLQVYLCLFAKCYRRCVYMSPLRRVISICYLLSFCRAHAERGRLDRCIALFKPGFLSASYPLRAATRERRNRDAHRRQPRKQGLTVRHAGVPMAASRCITPAAQHVMDGATDSQWH